MYKNTLLARRLYRRIQKAGYTFPPYITEKNVCILRTYAGRHQRSIGAWSWSIGNIEGVALDIGSSETAKNICEAPEISFNETRWGDISIVMEGPEGFIT